MRAFTRIVTAVLFTSAAVLTMVPAASAAPLPSWCKSSTSCATQAPVAATPDGWCLVPGTDICRRY